MLIKAPLALLMGEIRERERERERVLPVGKIKPAHLVRGQEGDSVRTVVVAHLFPRLCLFLSPPFASPLCPFMLPSWGLLGDDTDD